MVKFLTFATGGSTEWKGRDMKTAHAKLVDQGLGDGEFDLVGITLQASLEECNVPAEYVQVLMGAVESMRGQVLGRE